MPFTVGTTTHGASTTIMSQRKIFYANGRWWVFYNDGSNFVYRTSGDGGSTWSDATVLKSGGGPGYVISVHFDGNYVHYAYAANSHLYYRRGTPNSDGTISWSANEQTAVSVAGGDYCNFPAITVDTSGYPWIGYVFHNAAAGTDTPYITKSSANDGTWTTDAGFPIQLSITNYLWHTAVPVALTSNKVYIVYGANNETIKGKLYDGGMGAEETASTTNCLYGNKSVCADGDDVHVVFPSFTDATLIYIKRTDSTWSSETNIRDGDATINLRGTIGIDNKSRLYIISHLSNTLQIHRYWASWQQTHSYTETQPDINVPVIAIVEYRHLIGFLWAAGAASPYDIRFYAIGVSRAETAVAPTTL